MNNPPAFPVKGFQTRAGQGFVNIEAQGMTLRDYFAAKAMQALLDGDYYDATARMAYDMADAMLAAREKA
jgi:hypothetical protein